MSKEPSDLSSLPTEHDDEVPHPSSIVVIDSDDRTSLYDVKKVAPHVLQQFFDDVRTDDGVKSARCLLCDIIIKQSTESTFNYKRHVERKHKVEMDRWQAELEMKEKVKDKKQMKLQQSFVRKSELFFQIHNLKMRKDSLDDRTYGAQNPRQQELTRMVVHDLIIDLGLPVSIVDHPTFVRAMNIVDPKFVLVSRRSLCRKVLPTALEELMVKLKRICYESRFLSLTLDIWTDRRVRAFLAITMHTINEVNGNFNNYLITFRPLSGMCLFVFRFCFIFSI